ncbi:MAG: hypothetical protein A2202_07645 [Bdellovibrionales bacterium RIFOXYA1_FULL_36_14]|nr:MAG: hypothetical protein A2202_07645 [Bdellovibrionales bacterium RIFOXYA1_FULL_36_14]
MNQDTQVIIPAKVDLSKSIRTFKSGSEVELFYRFVNDNDLRREAGIMLNVLISGLRRMKKRKPQANKQVQ